LDAVAVIGALFPGYFSALQWFGVQEAMYPAFFKLSLGTGVIVALCDYLPFTGRDGRCAAGVLTLTLLVTLCAAIVFGAWLDGFRAQLGGGLQQLFVVLPAILDARWQLSLIYVLIALVALASSIALLEPLTRVLQR